MQAPERLVVVARQPVHDASTSAWDGAWYRRAFYDDGTPLGTAAEGECRIDAVAQSWAGTDGWIDLVDDGARHAVTVVLGAPAPASHT